MAQDRLGPTPIEARIQAMQHAVANERPVLNDILTQKGDMPLGEYVRGFKTKEAEPLQSRDDFIELAAQRTAKLFGEETGQKMKRRLEESSAIVTANHMGPDYVPFLWQSNLIVSLGETEGSVVPIFAGGVVPMRNAADAQNITLQQEYEESVGKDDRRKVQVKIPIFPYNKFANALVAATPAYTSQMINQAMSRADGFAGQGRITKHERNILKTVLKEDYLDPSVLGIQSYSDQCSILNNRLWKRMLAKDIRDQAPEMTILEVESVTGPLAAKDLKDRNSLLYKILFDKDLRAGVVDSLEGVPGCWDRTGKTGTMFFSAVDGDMQRVDLDFVERDGKEYLIGKGFEMPFEPETLSQALSQRRIFPSVFTTFVEMAFARGFKCYGGFMQTDYLTRMKRGVASSLECTGYEEEATKVSQVPTENYSTGMIAVMRRYPDGGIKPAGGIEVISKGGLTSEQLQMVRDLPLKHANLLNLPSIYDIVFSGRVKDSSLSSLSAEEIYNSVKPQTVELVDIPRGPKTVEPEG